MTFTCETDKIFPALVAFQGEASNPPRSADNPYFKSKYTPLDVVIDHVKPIMLKYGLAVIQTPCSSEEGVGVQTMLVHTSGQYILAEPYMLKLSKQDAQAGGSAITYARRYAYLSVLGLAPDTDDDGNAASEVSKSSKQDFDIAVYVAEKNAEIKKEFGINNTALKEVVDEMKAAGKFANKPSTQMTKSEYDSGMKAVREALLARGNG